MKMVILNIALILAFILSILFIFFNVKFTATEKKFGYFLVANAVFEIIAYISDYLEINNNLPGLHAYTLVKFILLCSFFGAAIRELGVMIRWKSILIIGTLAITLNSLFVQNIYSFNSFSATGVELLVVLACMTVFLLKLGSELKMQIDFKPIVIFTVASFVKSSFSIMIFLYSTEVAKMAKDFGVKIWLINVLINIATSTIILYGIALIIKREEKPIFKFEQT